MMILMVMVIMVMMMILMDRGVKKAIIVDPIGDGEDHH